MTSVVIASFLVTASAIASTEQGSSSQPLRNVAGIVAHRGGKQVPIGTAFFGAVPSHVFEGRSFVYLVTAHHNLLDSNGKPAEGLGLTFEDAKTGITREEGLPPES